jgi:hypothetical protein
VKIPWLLGLIALASTSAYADTSLMRSDAQIGDQTRYRTPLVFRQIHFDFNDNTLGEVVIKLNGMIRNEMKGQRNENVLLELDGFSEPEIMTILGRRMLNWQPVPGSSLSQIVAYIAQSTNCRIERKGFDTILNPLPPYKAYNAPAAREAFPTASR